MFEQNMTLEQYKEQIDHILKDKFNLFLVGVAVVLTLVVSSIYYLQSGSFSLFKIASLSTPKEAPPNSVDVKGVVEKGKSNNTIDTNLIPTDIVKNTETEIDNSKKKDEGEISAIMTKKVKSGKKHYVVQEGDSLASIAEDMYGDSNAWTIIAKANSLASPDLISVDMKLKIPR